MGGIAACDDAETPNKATVAAFWSDDRNKRKFDWIDDLFAVDIVIRSAGKEVGPRDRFRAWVVPLFQYIEDLKLEVHVIFADGDKLITRWTCSGGFVGEMFGIKGTGQPVSFTGIKNMTVRDGRIVEAWVERDALGLARQVGAVK